MAGPIFRKVPGRHDQKQTQQKTRKEVELAVIDERSRGKVYINFHQFNSSLEPVLETITLDVSGSSTRHAVENEPTSSDPGLQPGFAMSLREWTIPLKGLPDGRPRKSW
jgi:hypothetical protein